MEDASEEPLEYGSAGNSDYLWAATDPFEIRWPEKCIRDRSGFPEARESKRCLSGKQQSSMRWHPQNQ
jgi:hypothetical protein